MIAIRNGRSERRFVKVEAANESLAAVEGSIAAGDRVLLVDPTAAPR